MRFESEIFLKGTREGGEKTHTKKSISLCVFLSQTSEKVGTSFTTQTDRHGCTQMDVSIPLTGELGGNWSSGNYYTLSVVWQ